MFRMLPAMLVLTLAACSSGGGSGTSSTSGAQGNGASTGGSNGAGSGTGSGGGVASATTGSASASGGTATVDTFNAAFNAAYCNRLFECVAAAPYIFGICNGLVIYDFADLPLAVDAGRASFDAAKASTCLSTLANRNCADTNSVPPICEQAIGGQVAGTGVCYANEDCQSLGCSGFTASTCSPGTCLGEVNVGGACDCINCGACDPSKDLTCYNQICTTPGQQGAACGGGMVSCDTGLDCINGTCVTIPVGPGQPCNRGDGDCQAGSYCFETSSASVGNCATQVATGQPCGQDADHQDNVFQTVDSQCVQGDVCLGTGTLMDAGVAAGTCTPYADIGGTCSVPPGIIDPNDPYNMGCFPGLNCVTGTCARPPSSGTCSTLTEACDLTTSYCASATNTCQPYVQPGGSCNPSDSQACGILGSCETPNDICQSQTPGCSPTL